MAVRTDGCSKSLNSLPFTTRHALAPTPFCYPQRAFVDGVDVGGSSISRLTIRPDILRAARCERPGQGLKDSDGDIEMDCGGRLPQEYSSSGSDDISSDGECLMFPGARRLRETRVMARSGLGQLEQPPIPAFLGIKLSGLLDT